MGEIVSSAFDFLGANSQAKAAKAAGEASAAGYGQARDALTDYLNKSLPYMQPYSKAGSGAVNTLSRLMQPGGALTNTNFTAADFNANKDPGYDWRVSQGLDAINKSAAARGGYFSGQTGIDLNNYAQGMASNEFANAYGRFMNSGNTLYDRLMGLTNTGMGAAGTMGNWTQGTGADIANTFMGAGNARANAYTNAGNAWGSMYRNIGQNLAGPANNFLAYMAG